MSMIKKTELKKLNKEQTEQKIHDMEKVLLELYGEGKPEKAKSVKKSVAALKFHLSELHRNAAAKSG